MVVLSLLLSNKLRPRFAIVGSGPGGFYTAHLLLKKLPTVTIDVIEKLPVPFGLVRFGVAPDHPNVKNVMKKLTILAKSEQCRFIGNVRVGECITVNELRKHYNGVVLAYGAEEENFLNIPGEQLRGIYSSKKIISWYNGLPGHRHFNPDLSGDVAVVIGHGNVAMDIARILLTPNSILKNTDMSSYAVDHLSKSNIKRIVLVGRRGPLQVAFTIRQLRELLNLPDCTPNLQSSDFDHIRHELNRVDMDKPRKRITELLIKVSSADYTEKLNSASKFWELKFLLSPVEFLSSKNGSVRAIKFEKNELTDNNEIRGTGLYEVIDCCSVFRCVRFKNKSIDNSVPFDHHRGIIPNKNGRVVDSRNSIVRGLYCSGWARSGPRGSILMTMNNAFQTATSIVEDVQNGNICEVESSHDIDILEIVQDAVLFSEWEKLDKEEVSRGQSVEKPREKITSLKEILQIMKWR